MDPDRMSRSHPHDGSPVFSAEMAAAMDHGNTVPDGSCVASGRCDRLETASPL